jgi:hypothetical protein
MKVAAALLTSTSSGASLPDRLHHGLDRDTVADVATDRGDLAARMLAHLVRRGLEQFQPPAADHELGAEFEKAASHRGSQARAAAGDENALSGQQMLFEHCLIPPCDRHYEDKQSSVT